MFVGLTDEAFAELLNARTTGFMEACLTERHWHLLDRKGTLIWGRWGFKSETKADGWREGTDGRQLTWSKWAGLFCNHLLGNRKNSAVVGKPGRTVTSSCCSLTPVDWWERRRDPHYSSHPTENSSFDCCFWMLCYADKHSVWVLLLAIKCNIKVCAQ